METRKHSRPSVLQVFQRAVSVAKCHTLNISAWHLEALSYHLVSSGKRKRNFTQQSVGCTAFCETLVPPLPNQLPLRNLDIKQPFFLVKEDISTLDLGN